MDQLLSELYEQGSEPVLALEEPETHLHPQAVRTLWRHVTDLPGQKIVTTHSPYFVQHVPFRDLRLVRLTANGTEVRSLPASFSASIPPLEDLDAVVERSAGRLAYDRASETLTVHGALDENLYRRLLTCCVTDERRPDLEGRLRDLRERSSLYIDDQELRSLETWARRIRGEIFFAERWLIVEGQADYLIVHAVAHALDYDLDRHGVSVIDAQNNGNPATFAALARAFGIPWLAVFDGDEAGLEYVEAIAGRGSSAEDLGGKCRTHAAGHLEAQFVADGLGPELREVLAASGIRDAHSLSDEDTVGRLEKNKAGYAAAFADRLRRDAALTQRAPEAFRATVEDLRGLAG